MDAFLISAGAMFQSLAESILILSLAALEFSMIVPLDTYGYKIVCFSNLNWLNCFNSFLLLVLSQFKTKSAYEEPRSSGKRLHENTFDPRSIH